MFSWKHLPARCEPLPKSGRIRILWEGQGFNLEAQVGDVDGRLRARSFQLTADESDALPGVARRLPTDAQILEALLDHPDGPKMIVWCRNALHELSPPDGWPVGTDRSEIAAAMDAYAHSQPKPKTTRPPIEEVRREIEWLKEQCVTRVGDVEGATAALVADFRATFHTSSATAYRRLKVAREELGET